MIKQRKEEKISDWIERIARALNMSKEHEDRAEKVHKKSQKPNSIRVMNKPKVIYIGKTVWCEEPITDSYPYFSEQAIKEVMKQVVEDTNRLVDISTTIQKTKLDADKYIPHVIDLLMKGGEE